MSRLTTMCLLNIKSWYLMTGTTNPKLVITVNKSELDNNEKKKRTSTRVKHLNHDTQLMKLSQFVSFCFMTWVTNAQLSSHLIELLLLRLMPVFCVMCKAVLEIQTHNSYFWKHSSLATPFVCCHEKITWNLKKNILLKNRFCILVLKVIILQLSCPVHFQNTGHCRNKSRLLFRFSPLDFC